MNLVALGAQDVFLTLTTQPRVSFFRQVYPRYGTSAGADADANAGDAADVVIDIRELCLPYHEFPSRARDTEPELCPICQEDLEPGTRVHVTDCCHTFHHGCLHEYVSKYVDGDHYQCPYCRTSLAKLYG